MVCSSDGNYSRISNFEFSKLKLSVIKMPGYGPEFPFIVNRTQKEPQVAVH